MLKVGVVDDHNLFRKSLILVLSCFVGMDIVLDAANGEDLFEKLLSTEIDVLLLDIQMPGMNGYEACKRVRMLYPAIKILFVSNLKTKESVHLAMEVGAHGYFSKNGDPELLETAIKTVHTSGFYFEPGLGAILQEAILWDKKEMSVYNPLSTLTEREIMVIGLFCRGYNANEISNLLSVNIRTVESYRNRIIEKTEAKSFMNVVLMAIKYNYIAMDTLLVKD